MARIDLDQLARAAAAKLPRERWIVARTPLGEPYPCRCHERPAWARRLATWECSAAFCPCSGRDPDGMPPECCSWRRSPADHVMAKAAWDLKKRQEEELLS